MTQSVFPQLRITDYERSKVFYIGGLGFQVAWEHRFAPHLPVFTQITRAGVSLFLSQHAGDGQVGGAAYIYVPDVDACYRDFVNRGVRPESAPSDASYGVREMCVVDPDGNRLRFGTPLPGGDAAPGAPAWILWRRLDTPGHESARLSSQRSGWHLTGTAVFAHDRQPCRLDYVVACDSTWQTISGRVAGWVGSARVEIDVSVDPARGWRLNGTECPAVAGCSDLDLHFSPSTNFCRFAAWR